MIAWTLIICTVPFIVERFVAMQVLQDRDAVFTTVAWSINQSATCRNIKAYFWYYIPGSIVKQSHNHIKQSLCLLNCTLQIADLFQKFTCLVVSVCFCHAIILKCFKLFLTFQDRNMSRQQLSPLKTFTLIALQWYFSCGCSHKMLEDNSELLSSCFVFFLKNGFDNLP